VTKFGGLLFIDHPTPSISLTLLKLFYCNCITPWAPAENFPGAKPLYLSPLPPPTSFTESFSASPVTYYFLPFPENKFGASYPICLGRPYEQFPRLHCHLTDICAHDND